MSKPKKRGKKKKREKRKKEKNTLGNNFKRRARRLETSSLTQTRNRALKCDIKLWDLLRCSERTTCLLAKNQHLIVIWE